VQAAYFLCRKALLCKALGTSVFFAFRQYSRLLVDERTIHVLIADPDDSTLISVMDKIYVYQENVANRWARMMSQINGALDSLHADALIRRHGYEKLKAILSGGDGYRNVIIGSIYLWGLAQSTANVRLRSLGRPVTVHGLDLRVYNVLPGIKAWIVDDASCALGHYKAIHLGRDNPVDIYRPSKRRAMEHWQFENVMGYLELQTRDITKA
jgi:hypothetical protein